jgi:hypothetical protein
MDGAPYLRKIDLGLHKGYLELALALEKLFGCCGIGKLHIFHSFFLYFIFKSFLLFNLLHDLLMVAI